MSRQQEIRDAAAARARSVLEARRAGRTLADIGKELGITRERVRQLEAKALWREFKTGKRAQGRRPA